MRAAKRHRDKFRSASSLIDTRNKLLRNADRKQHLAPPQSRDHRRIRAGSRSVRFRPRSPSRGRRASTWNGTPRHPGAHPRVGRRMDRPKEPSDTSLIRTLWQDIDRGEAEAFALATDIKADRVLIDERDARRRARNLGLEVTGALGILLRAAQEGSLDSLPNAIDRLEDEAGFWVAPALRRHILKNHLDE